MALKNTAESYGWLAKLFHWGVAGLVFYLIYLGLDGSSMPSGDEKSASRALHKSVALLTLALMAARLAWRLMNPRPDGPPGIPAWQNAAAVWAHRLLYAAVFFQITVGLLVASQRPISFFGLFEIPAFLAENEEQHELFEELHETGWIVIAVLIGVHVLAALYHHFKLKDNVLKRMTTG